VVVDNQQAARSCLSSQLIHKTSGRFRAVPTKALVAVTGYLWPETGLLAQPVEFRPVAAGRLQQPGVNLLNPRLGEK